MDSLSSTFAPILPPSTDLTSFTAREGEVVVVLGWVGGLRELHADEGFLRSTSPDLLRYALTEAFTAAQEGPRA